MGKDSLLFFFLSFSFCHLLLLLLSSSSLAPALAIDFDGILRDLKANAIEFNHSRSADDKAWENIYHTLQFSDQHYLHQHFARFLRGENIYVAAMDVSELGFGNSFGNYFEMVSVARLLGAHFLGVWKSEPPKYFDHLPTRIVHEHPLSINVSITKMQALNLVEMWPWEFPSPNAAWRSKIEQLGNLLDSLTQAYLSDAYHSHDLSHIQLPASEFDESNVLLTQQPPADLFDKQHIPNFVMNQENRKKYFQKEKYGSVIKSQLALNLRCRDLFPLQ